MRTVPGVDRDPEAHHATPVVSAYLRRVSQIIIVEFFYNKVNHSSKENMHCSLLHAF